jgi:hypothetical protein
MTTKKLSTRYLDAVAALSNPSIGLTTVCSRAARLVADEYQAEVEARLTELEQRKAMVIREDSKEPDIVWRGSITDLATDLAALLTTEQGIALSERLLWLNHHHPEKFKVMVIRANDFTGEIAPWYNRLTNSAEQRQAISNILSGLTQLPDTVRLELLGVLTSPIPKGKYD